MKIKRHLILLVLLVLVAAFTLSGCATTPYTNRSQFMVMDESEEMAMSLDAYNEVVQTSKIEKGTTRAKQIVTIGQRIAAVADKPDYKWEFLTIADDGTINAMCLPGGKVFVYTGIIKLTGGNADQLAAIMGHEIAHAIARHGAESASMQQTAAIGAGIAGVVAGSLLGIDTNTSSELAGTLAALGVTLPHSRMQEAEADKIGLILMAKAGYNPEAAVTLWEKMAALNSGNEPLSILSTHPLNADRIKNIKQQLPEVMPYYEAAKAKK